MFRVVAHDQNNIPRCFGIAKTKEDAREECLLAVYEKYSNSERGRDIKFKTLSIDIATNEIEDCYNWKSLNEFEDYETGNKY